MVRFLKVRLYVLELHTEKVTGKIRYQISGICIKIQSKEKRKGRERKQERLNVGNCSSWALGHVGSLCYFLCVCV